MSHIGDKELIHDHFRLRFLLKGPGVDFHIIAERLALECPMPKHDLWETDDGYLVREKFEDALKQKNEDRLELDIQFLINNLKKLKDDIGNGAPPSKAASTLRRLAAAINNLQRFRYITAGGSPYTDVMPTGYGPFKYYLWDEGGDPGVVRVPDKDQKLWGQQLRDLDNEGIPYTLKEVKPVGDPPSEDVNIWDIPTGYTTERGFPVYPYNENEWTSSVAKPKPKPK